MADENKDSTKPISSGVAPGPSEHRREDIQTTGSPYTTGTSSAALSSASGTGSGSQGIGTSSGTTRDRLKETTAGMASTARNYAGDMANRAKDKGRTVFEQQKETALGQVGSVAQAIRSTASNLQGEGQDQTARYVQMLADQLESLSGRLRDKDLDTLVQDAQNLARRSPGTLIVGSVVAGFLLARFLKSSSERQVGYTGYDDDQRRVLSAGEAGPYSGTATPTRNLSADGTPGTGASTSGINATNLGGGAI